MTKEVKILLVEDKKDNILLTLEEALKEVVVNDSKKTTSN